MGESQGERELHLGESEGDQKGSMKREGWTPQCRNASLREEREGKQENLPRRSRWKH